MTNLFINNPKQSEIKDAIIRAINDAHYEILIALYIFTDTDIFDAIEKFIENKRNTFLSILLDEEQVYREGSEVIERLIKLQNKYPDRVFYKIISHHDAIMHHKFIIIDRCLLGMGSYNFSFNAHNYNYESFVFITSYENPDIFKKIINEFFHIMAIDRKYPSLANCSVECYPAILVNSKVKILNNEDTIYYVYPIKILLRASGDFVFKIVLRYPNNEGKITEIPLSSPLEHLLSMDSSGKLEIYFLGWNGEVVKIEKFIHIDKKNILSTQAFEIFFDATQKITRNFEKYLYQMFEKSEIIN